MRKVKKKRVHKPFQPLTILGQFVNLCARKVGATPPYEITSIPARGRPACGFFTALGFNLAPACNVLVMLCQCDGKRMSACAICHKENELAVIWLRGCHQARAARIGNWRGRQPVDYIGVPRRLCAQLRPPQTAPQNTLARQAQQTGNSAKI